MSDTTTTTTTTNSDAEQLDESIDRREPLTGPRYYVAEANPGGTDSPAHFPGVPLRDLEAAEFEALPLWLQYSVDESPMYRRTKPRAAAQPEQ